MRDMGRMLIVTSPWRRTSSINFCNEDLSPGEALDVSAENLSSSAVALSPAMSKRFNIIAHDCTALPGNRVLRLPSIGLARRSRGVLHTSFTSLETQFVR